MYHSIHNLDKDHIGFSPLKAGTKQHQAPLLTKMASGLRDSRSDRRRMIRDPDEVMRAKRKLMAAMNQSESRLGLRTQTPVFLADLQDRGHNDLLEGTQPRGADVNNKEANLTKTIGGNLETNDPNSLALVDLETEQIIHYDINRDKQITKNELQIDVKQTKALKQNRFDGCSEQLINAGIKSESLRYYEGQSTPFFPYLVPDRQSGPKLSKSEHQHVTDKIKDNNSTTNNKTKKKDKTEKNKKPSGKHHKAQSAKVYPINIPEDSQNPRTKADMERIAAMFCVVARKTPVSDKPKKALYDEDSDDDDCFRPGVWGCEFDDINLVKADVDYYNIDLNIMETRKDNPIPKLKTKIQKNVKADYKAENNKDLKKSGNVVVRFLRRLFRMI